MGGVAVDMALNSTMEATPGIQTSALLTQAINSTKYSASVKIYIFVFFIKQKVPLILFQMTHINSCT